MHRFVPFIALGLLLTACSGANTTGGATNTGRGKNADVNTAPSAVASAPAPQTGTAGRATPTATADGTPGATLRGAPVPSKAVTDITEQVRPKSGELPQGFGFGQFQGYQPNESAVQGFANPEALLKRMNDTGRLGGFFQQIGMADSPGGAGITIDVWQDAAGAKAYFDDYPRPEGNVDLNEIPVPQPLGEQSYAIEYRLNGQTGYSLAWRRGRIILGAGAAFPPGKAALDKLQPLLDLLDKKAQAAQQ